jgi:hypothetical protein
MRYFKTTGSILVFIVLLLSVTILFPDKSSAQDLSDRATTGNQLTDNLYAKTTDSHQSDSAAHDADDAAHGSGDTTHGSGDTTHGSGDTTHGSGDTTHGSGHANLGPILPLWSCIPFAGMLLSIALFPLVAPEFWHHHFGKISAFWAATLGIPFLIAFKGDAVYEILHIVLADYVPFIILLWSLYTVSGGILLRGTLRGTPVVNVVILIIGTVLASWMGTTGAAMLLIRPFLRANNYRKNRTFIADSPG